MTTKIVDVKLQPDGVYFKHPLFINGVGLEHLQAMLNETYQANVKDFYHDLIEYALNEGCDISSPQKVDIIIDGRGKKISIGGKVLSISEFIKDGLRNTVPNIVKFRYTKSNGETSLRRIDVLDDDGDYVYGLDKDDGDKYKKFIKENIKLAL